ncbi:MAG: virulence RhuM family protein [Lachnospiraceae bacterium]|nr:virulence RhuM family protein [Lachnospiraceae bacterium]
MPKKKNTEITIRSAAAEYLTYVAATGDAPESFEMRYENENICLTQRMMAELYGVDVRTVNDHLKKVFADGELPEEATIRKFRIVQTEGSRQVSREVIHYNLQAIIAVGFKVGNDRAVQFRKWAGQIVKSGVSIAKNYLSETEMSYLERIVSLYLDYAELQAERKIPMSMEDWARRLDGFLEFNGNELLTGPGKSSAEEAKLHAESEYEKYRIVQDRLFESDFDRFLRLEGEVSSVHEE